MIQAADTGFYCFADCLFVDKLTPGQTIRHQIKTGVWVLDFALDGAIEIDGIAILPGNWRLTKTESGHRIVKKVDRGRSGFLSIGIQENTYDEYGMDPTGTHGVLTSLMIYPLLKIISIIRDEGTDTDQELSLKCYIPLLLNRINKADYRRSPFLFEDLLRIFRLIREVELQNANFPTAADLTRQSRMYKSRFQKACLVIYGQSAQKIIQHLKMSRAFQATLFERKEISKTSASLGYRFSPNFITAFRNHFSLTPMEAVRYQADNYSFLS